MMKLLILTLLISCGSHQGRPTHSENQNDIRELRTYWLQDIQKHQGEAGFIDTDHCDALLFSGLAAYGGMKVDLTAAEGEPGQWFRRPAKDCYPGNSRSTISRDQLLGVMWASIDNLPRLRDLWAWGDANNWFMGEGRLGGADTIMPPAYIALLADLLLAAGDNSSAVKQWTYYPNNVDGDCKAYVCHVNVLRHYLRAKVGKKKLDYVELAKISDRYPDNPLFAWAAGRRRHAVNLLVGHYQNGPLCEFYPLQENGGDKNWAKCEDGDSTGAGFLFLSQLMLEEAQ